MPRKGYRPEEIIAKLREADVLLGQGKRVAEVVKALGVSEVTYYRWRQEGVTSRFVRQSTLGRVWRGDAPSVASVRDPAGSRIRDRETLVAGPQQVVRGECWCMSGLEAIA